MIKIIRSIVKCRGTISFFTIILMGNWEARQAIWLWKLQKDNEWGKEPKTTKPSSHGAAIIDGRKCSLIKDYFSFPLLLQVPPLLSQPNMRVFTDILQFVLIITEEHGRVKGGRMSLLIYMYSMNPFSRIDSINYW